MSARIIFVVLICLLSVLFLWQFGPSTVSTIPHMDKAVHFGAFFILAFAFHRAFPLPIWVALPLLTAYGLAIEYAQSLTPYRSADWLDLVADAAGATAYYALHWLHKLWRRSRTRKRQH